MRQDGFTLIEVLLALALLGVLIPACLQIQSSTKMYISRARLATEAARLAECLLERELAQPLSVEETGHEGMFRWQLERRHDELTVIVFWQEYGRERCFEVVTLIADL